MIGQCGSYNSEGVNSRGTAMAKVHALGNQDVPDVPEGYKITELGPLSEEWRVVSLEPNGGIDDVPKY